MKVGLTGGIGCGKTTVLRLFRQLGVPCFEADAHAADYYEEPDFLDEIRVQVSPDVFLPTGEIDKQALAQLVFRRRDKLAALCAVVHPRVMSDFERWTAMQTAPYVMLESAILFEYRLERFVQSTVAVYVEKEERLARLMQRDHTSRAAIEARMRNQWSAEEKMDRADYVVLNYEGNPRERQVREIHRRLLLRATAYRQTPLSSL